MALHMHTHTRAVGVGAAAATAVETRRWSGEKQEQVRIVLSGLLCSIAVLSAWVTSLRAFGWLSGLVVEQPESRAAGKKESRVARQ